jgi:hypothetical protein
MTGISTSNAFGVFRNFNRMYTNGKDIFTIVSVWTVTILSLWGALSDERTDLSVVKRQDKLHVIND